MKEPFVPSTNSKEHIPCLCIYIATGKNNVEPLQADAGWQLEKELGYVYTSPVDGAIPLYEAANENDYCYTTEDKQAYGIEGSWKKTGIVCYTMPL